MCYNFSGLRNEVFIMKVSSISPISFASNEILPAACTSKPQVACTATLPRTQPKGCTNEEIYDALVAFKNFVLNPFKPNQQKIQSINAVV